jgi:AmmeMemoRadiSam system protein B
MNRFLLASVILAALLGLVLTASLTKLMPFPKFPQMHLTSSQPPALSSQFQQTSCQSQTTTDYPTHHNHFFIPQFFHRGLAYVEQQTRSTEPLPIKTVITPHDLTASHIITDIISQLPTTTTTIIILGPNHDEAGHFPVLTSRYAWQSQVGIIEPNVQIIDSLINQSFTHVDETVLPNDHAVAGIMPYLSHYLCHATVVPLLISGTVTLEQTQQLAQALTSYLQQPDTVLIAAIDFSHYLTSADSKTKDQHTLQLIEQLDYEQILDLNNDYTDSPPTLVTLLQTNQNLNLTNQQILHHTDLADLNQNPHMPTTSYFGIIYY